MTHEQIISTIFSRLRDIFNLKDFQFKTMRRQIDSDGRGIINLKKSYVLAHTNLKTKSITIDIYTPRHRKPKSLKSVLNILAHEISHHQKPPFRQIWHRRIIARQHYPEFYSQVNKNIEKIKKDEVLKKFYSQA